MMSNLDGFVFKFQVKSLNSIYFLKLHLCFDT